MNNRLYAIAARWGNILCLGLIGGISYGYFASHYGTLVVLEAGTLFARGCENFGYASCIGLSVLLIGFVHRLARINLRHARHVLQYPPFAMAVVVGLLIASALPSPASTETPLAAGEAVAAALVYLLIWFAQSCAYFLTETRPLAVQLPHLIEPASGKLSDDDG